MPGLFEIAIISAVVFGVAMACLAVGVIIANRSIKGSCGGLNNFRDSQGRPICDACSNPSPDCTGNPQAATNEESEPVEEEETVSTGG